MTRGELANALTLLVLHAASWFLLAEAARGTCTSTSFRACWGASHVLHRELEVVRRDLGIQTSGGGG